MASAASVSGLNDMQQLAFDAAVGGHNLFITGGAGTGKSVLIRALKRRLSNSALLAAPTGVAALNIDGVTIASLFKGEGKALKEPRTLILDEASMIAPDLVTRLYATAKRVRNCDAPWGDLQVILVGDLAQLPPVIKEAHRTQIDRKYGGVPYFFASNVFRGFKLVELAQVMRQADPVLCHALNELRHGRHNATTATVFDACVAPRPADVPVLVARTRQAAEINGNELARLATESRTCEAQVKGDLAESEYPVDKSLTLKIGARVILARNAPDGAFVNGDIGTVTAFVDEERAVEVQLDRGHGVRVHRVLWQVKRAERTGNEVYDCVVGEFAQLPIRLGWAISIHKAQGLTLDRVHVDLGHGTFAHGQAYVALSRCRSLAGLTLERTLRPADVLFDHRALAFRHLFEPLGAPLVDQVRGCTAYNQSGRPFMGLVQLPRCPLARNGCPRISHAVAVDSQHALHNAATT